MQRPRRQAVFVSGAPGAGKTSLAVPLAADAPSVVVEANFRPHHPYQRGKLAALADDPVEVYCRCDPGLAARRYRDRARTGHPVHVVTSLTPDMLAEYDRPVGIGEVITVDTAGPVDAAAVAAAVRACLETRAGRGGGP
jgi:hypothetical protein